MGMGVQDPLAGLGLARKQMDDNGRSASTGDSHFFLGLLTKSTHRFHFCL